MLACNIMPKKESNYFSDKYLSEFKPLYTVMNKKFDSATALNITKKGLLSDNLRNLEDVWMDNYFYRVTDFMGSHNVITSIFRHYKQEVPFEITTTRDIKGKNHKYILKGPPTIRDLGGHFTARIPDSVWAARKETATTDRYYKGNNEFFDPYMHYQLNGSNQFCQTYALMYLVGKCKFTKERLDINNKEQFHKFYEFTKDALNFIHECLTVVTFPPEVENDEIQDIKKSVEVLLRYHCLCLNLPDDNIDGAFQP